MAIVVPRHRMRWFATAVPGIGCLLAQQLARRPGVHIGATGFDGRNDIVAFDTDSVAAPQIRSLTTMAEDVFAQIGHTARRDGNRPTWIAQRLCHRTPIAEALAQRRQFFTPPPTPTLRIVVRVLSERAFTRTQLRSAVTAAVGRLRPDWTPADPACHELWVLEYQTGTFIAGIRMTDHKWRQGDGREIQRHAALRPSVASAMVTLAGNPGRLIDPCCGTGTILQAAQAAGWHATGIDIDPAAVKAARRNTTCTDISIGDAHVLPYADHSFDAWVSNPPFGKQHALAADANRWLGALYQEAARVVRPAGHIVVLHPRDPREVCDLLEVQERHRLRLLGYDTTLWRITNQAGPPKIVQRRETTAAFAVPHGDRQA